MRKIIVSAAVAVVAAVSFAAPSQAGYYGYKQKCFVKTIKAYDDYGKVVIRKVRICK